MEKNRRASIYVGILIVLSILTGTALLSCSKQPGAFGTPPATKITIGIQVSPAMALIMVAKDKGFFAEEGLDVDLKEFTAGKFALQAFLSHSIDFAVSGEVPVALAAMQGNQIRVVSQVVASTSNEVRVVALKDGNLTDPKAYFQAKKRKLATSFGGGPEFFTYNFLRQNNIGKDQIEVLSQNPSDMPAALETGSVDAISIFDPFAFIAEKQMGQKVVTFSNAQLYSELYVLTASPEQVAQKPQIITSVLKALVKAGDFIQKNPAESKQIMQQYTKLDPGVIDGIWGNFSFHPALTQQLLNDWNAEFAWAKDTNKVTPNAEAPNFREMIEDRFLKSVAPDAIKL